MLLNLTLVGYKEFCRSWGVLSNSAFYGGPCKHKEHVKKNQLLHTANKKDTVKQKYAHCKQNNCTLQTKKNLTVNKVHTTSKRMTRYKQNSCRLQTRKKL